MKKLKIKLSYALYTVLCVVFLTNCNQRSNKPKSYTWETNIEVRFSDNTKDTVVNKVKRKNKPDFTLHTINKPKPCLVLRGEIGGISEILACDVKTYKILKQAKKP